MSTQAADAWMILNDADVVETKMLATMNKVFGDRSNREMFMTQLANTNRFHDAVVALQMNGSMTHSIEEIIRRTMESAEVMIQEDFRTNLPRIAIRFKLPQGGTFIVQPRVIR